MTTVSKRARCLSCSDVRRSLCGLILLDSLSSIVHSSRSGCRQWPETSWGTGSVWVDRTEQSARWLMIWGNLSITQTTGPVDNPPSSSSKATVTSHLVLRVAWGTLREAGAWIEWDLWTRGVFPVSDCIDIKICNLIILLKLVELSPEWVMRHLASTHTHKHTRTQSLCVCVVVVTAPFRIFGPLNDQVVGMFFCFSLCKSGVYNLLHLNSHLGEFVTDDNPIRAPKSDPETDLYLYSFYCYDKYKWSIAFLFFFSINKTKIKYVFFHNMKIVYNFWQVHMAFFQNKRNPVPHRISSIQ